MNIQRSIITTGMAAALAVPATANAVLLLGTASTVAAQHSNTATEARSVKHEGQKRANSRGGFANIPGFNVAVQAGIGKPAAG